MDETIDMLWEKLNKSNSFYENSSFLVSLTNKNGILNQIFESTKSLEDKESVKLEQKAIFFFLGIFHYLSYLDKPEFISTFNDNVVEFVKETIERDSDYYLKRYKETSNHFDKIWYGFICWILRKDIQIFNETLDFESKFLKALVERNEEYMDTTHNLCFTFNLILLYGIKREDLNLHLIKFCEQIITNVSKEPNKFRYLIEPAKISARINKTNMVRINSLLDLLQKTAMELQTKFKEKFSVSEGLLEASLDLSNCLTNLSSNKINQLKNSIHEQIGALNENVAKYKLNKGEHPLVASFFYNKAAVEYLKAGNANKHEECLRLCSENTVFDKATVTKIEIPSVNITGDTEVEIINTLIEIYIENEIFISSEEVNRELVSNQMGMYPLSSALSRQSYTKLGPSSRIYSNPDEKVKAEVKDSIKNNVLLFESIISNTALNLECQKKLTSPGIKDFIEGFGIFDSNSLYIIDRGLIHHFQTDYVASVHILIPQIETLLRKLLQLKKISYFKKKKDILMAKELGGLLELNELKEILGPRLIQYLKIKYTDPNGINFRNILSHGFLEKEDFNHVNSFSIIFMIFLILIMAEKNETHKSQ